MTINESPRRTLLSSGAPGSTNSEFWFAVSSPPSPPSSPPSIVVVVVASVASVASVAFASFPPSPPLSSFFVVVGVVAN